MAIHSTILAWRIPWTKEPGGLQSTGSQKSRIWLKRLNLHNLCSEWHWEISRTNYKLKIIIMIITVEKLFHHWRTDLVDCDLNKCNLRHLFFCFLLLLWFGFFFFGGIYSQAISFCFFWDIFFFRATSSSDLGIICSFSVKIISVWPGELMYGLIWPWALQVLHQQQMVFRGHL